MSLRYALIIGLPCAMGLSALSDPILCLLYNDTSAHAAAMLLTLLAPSSLLVCILAITNSVLQGCGKEKMPVTVEQARFFKNMVILKFKEMNRIEDCEPFRNKDILITRDQAVKLNPDENFIADLIGLKVLTDEGEEFGTVKDILQTAANDVYLIEGPEGKEYLFPSIKECILNVDLEAGTVTVHIMDGLLDL